MPESSLRNAFESAAVPIARLLGHALAAGLGFGALALISLIPALTLKAMIWLGFTELTVPLHALATALLVADVLLFSVVLGAAMVDVAVDAIAKARSRMRTAWRGERE